MDTFTSKFSQNRVKFEWDIAEVKSRLEEKNTCLRTERKVLNEDSGYVCRK